MIVRELNERDALTYRLFRMQALKTEIELYGEGPHEEETLPLEHWVNECRETTDKCMFGLFDEMKLAGILMARRWESDSSGKTAYWGYAYTKPEYRHRKLAKPLYQLREEWTKRKKFTHVVFCFGKQNAKSLDIHRRRGALYTHTEFVTTKSGEIEPWYWFKIELPQPNDRQANDNLTNFVPRNSVITPHACALR